MTGDGGISVPDRLRRMEERQEATLELVQEISSRDKADYVRFQHLSERVTAVESWQTWALRVVVAAVMVALLGLLWA